MEKTVHQLKAQHANQHGAYKNQYFGLQAGDGHHGRAWAKTSQTPAYAKNEASKNQTLIDVTRLWPMKYLARQALVFSFKINDDSFIAQSYNTLGGIYNECSEIDKAIEFYNKALIYAQKVNDNSLYNWIYGNNFNMARYNNLAPGEYVLKVKASNNDGVWKRALSVTHLLG